MQNAAQITAASTRAARLAQVRERVVVCLCQACRRSFCRCLLARVVHAVIQPLRVDCHLQPCSARCAFICCRLAFSTRESAPTAAACCATPNNPLGDDSLTTIAPQVTKWMRLWNIIRLWCFYWKHRWAEGLGGCLPGL